MNLKKAAMFGLDARIALAIFGALSVISGAALYSAIQNAEVTAIVTEMREVGKAWEAYYLDTGEQLRPRNSSNNAVSDFYDLRVRDLIEEPANITNWQGPYLSYAVDNDYRLIHPKYDYIHMIRLNDENTWGNTNSQNPGGWCTSGQKCYIWVMFRNFTDTKLAVKIDEFIDDGDGPLVGNFKYRYSPSVWWEYSLKITPIENPND